MCSPMQFVLRGLGTGWEYDVCTDSLTDVHSWMCIIIGTLTLQVLNRGDGLSDFAFIWSFLWLRERPGKIYHVRIVLIACVETIELTHAVLTYSRSVAIARSITRTQTCTFENHANPLAYRANWQLFTPENGSRLVLKHNYVYSRLLINYVRGHIDDSPTLN